jgi:hypothetical protein
MGVGHPATGATDHDWRSCAALLASGQVSIALFIVARGIVNSFRVTFCGGAVVRYLPAWARAGACVRLLKPALLGSPLSGIARRCSSFRCCYEGGFSCGSGDGRGGFILRLDQPTKAGTSSNAGPAKQWPRGRRQPPYLHHPQLDIQLSEVITTLAGLDLRRRPQHFLLLASA